MRKSTNWTNELISVLWCKTLSKASFSLLEFTCYAWSEVNHPSWCPATSSFLGSAMKSMTFMVWSPDPPDITPWEPMNQGGFFLENIVIFQLLDCKPWKRSLHRVILTVIWFNRSLLNMQLFVLFVPWTSSQPFCLRILAQSLRLDLSQLVQGCPCSYSSVAQV